MMMAIFLMHRVMFYHYDSDCFYSQRRHVLTGGA